LSLIRKVTWPAVIALSLLLFMGLASKATPVSAELGGEGDICGVFAGVKQFDEEEGLEAIGGDNDELPLMREETYIVVYAQIKDSNDPEDTTYEASIDSGSADVTIVQELEGTTTSDLQDVDTSSVSELVSNDPDHFSTGLINEFYDLGLDFAASADDDDVKNYDEDAGDCGGFDDGCSGDYDADEDGNACDDDEVVVVVIYCEEDGAGIFDVSFADEEEDDDSYSIEIACRGDSDDDNTTFDVNPATIEIIPAIGNVSHSFARLILEDANGDPAFPGQEVLFTVDKCGIEESEVDDEGTNDGDIEDLSGWKGAEELFRTRFSPNRPDIAQAIEESDYALNAPDSTEQEDNTNSFTVFLGSSDDTETTVAGAIVHCDIGHTQESTPTPGVVTVTAIVDQDGADDIFTAKITLVGPPATITVNASPAELRCGEKAQIVVVVKDSIGQNVSDHTQVEAVTNAGGVLGGTGAVIGFAGPVVPISSTVAETFGGTTTFFLLTSEQHSGPYEVVVTTGGANVTAAHNLSGLFSSPPISVQTTVKCTIPVVAAAAPAPVPTVTAPRTGDLGTGTIRPPSTGDAGLADSSSSNSWALVAIAGVVVFSLAGLATVKVTRR
jgi:hypothetical protein